MKYKIEQNMIYITTSSFFLVGSGEVPGNVSKIVRRHLDDIGLVTM